MNTIPIKLNMIPILVQKPLEMGHNPVIPVMECPEYAVRVLIRQMDNGNWKQIWFCDAVPGWFTNWVDLRARIQTCYDIAMSGH